MEVDRESIHEILDQVMGQGTAGLHFFQSNSDCLGLKSANDDRKAAQPVYLPKHHGVGMSFGCPIYTYENILESAGILMEDTGTGSGKKKKAKQEVVVEEQGSTGNEDLKTMTLEELDVLLNEVLENEDYIRAIAIRDEINTRKKNR